MTNSSLKRPKQHDPLFHFAPQLTAITGPSGSGKTAFGCAAMNQFKHLFPDPKNKIFYIAPDAVATTLRAEIPEELDVIYTFDLLDDRIFNDPLKVRKFVHFDEIATALDIYSFSQTGTKDFIKYVKVHRHKLIDLLYSDQAFEFVKGIRVRTHSLALTGMNVILLGELSGFLPRTFTEILKDYYFDLVDMHFDNKTTIGGERFGQVFLISDSLEEGGEFLTYPVPEWFSLDISECMHGFNLDALEAHQKLLAGESDDEDERISKKINTESDDFKALMLAYHLSKWMFKRKTLQVSREKISAAYTLASIIIMNEARNLPRHGRGTADYAIALHMASSVANEICPFCADRKLYVDILNDIKNDNILSDSNDLRRDPTVENSITALESSLHENFSNRLMTEALEAEGEEG